MTLPTPNPEQEPLTSAVEMAGDIRSMSHPYTGEYPCIGPGFRLQWEPAQNSHVLLYPEGMVRLNQSAGEILKRCDGQHSLSMLVSALETAFQSKGLATEITDFLHKAQQQRWIVWHQAPAVTPPES